MNVNLFYRIVLNEWKKAITIKNNNNDNNKMEKYTTPSFSLYLLFLYYTCITLAGKIWLKKIDD